MMVSILVNFAGAWEYHSTVLKGVKVNGRKLLLPPKVILNKNNNSEKKAILTLYRKSLDGGNPYAALKCYNGKFYSLMHDSI